MRLLIPLAIAAWTTLGPAVLPANPKPTVYRQRVGQELCLPETRDRIALNRGFLEWPASLKANFYETNVFALVTTGPGGGRYIDNVEVFLLTSPCQIAFHKVYPGDSARVRPDRLGSLDVIDVVSERHGGSGNGFTHELLADTPGGPVPLQAPTFSHGNMGGFYIGALGGGRGEGVVVWDAIWEAEDPTHYSPHRYAFTFYRWNGKSFEAPQRVETREKVTPDPDTAAKSSGYAFRDATGQDIMPVTFIFGG